MIEELRSNSKHGELSTFGDLAQGQALPLQSEHPIT